MTRVTWLAANNSPPGAIGNATGAEKVFGLGTTTEKDGWNRVKAESPEALVSRPS